ncbi:MAG: ABC transporter ATP-binding protein [Betaproteobacteria bacterium]|nr:ABC transporter ATP-binding protein [Betaproteobacteria bacterium]
MLSVSNLHAFYGKSHVLHGVNLFVGRGEIVSLLGRNGVGRSTTIKAIMGLVSARGTVAFQGRDDLVGLKPHEIALRGLGYVPEDRAIFPDITVRENLLLGSKGRQATPRWTMDDMFALFPRLEERADTAAGVLSGGEQQMLTLCRTLIGDPDLIMIDEPTEGLAPLIVGQVAELLREIKRRGVSILLVEQKLAIALDISDRVYVMGHGRGSFRRHAGALRENDRVRKEWLAV